MHWKTWSHTHIRKYLCKMSEVGGCVQPAHPGSSRRNFYSKKKSMCLSAAPLERSGHIVQAEESDKVLMGGRLELWGLMRSGGGQRPSMRRESGRMTRVKLEKRNFSVCEGETKKCLDFSGGQKKKITISILTWSFEILGGISFFFVFFVYPFKPCHYFLAEPYRLFGGFCFWPLTPNAYSWAPGIRLRTFEGSVHSLLNRNAVNQSSRQTSQR